MRRRVKAALHNLESASYATNDASKLETLLQRLEELNQSFRSSLPSEKGLCLRPSVLVKREKKIKQRALKRLRRAASLSSLENVLKGRPGRKKQHWKIRKRVGMKVQRLKKVSPIINKYSAQSNYPRALPKL